MTRNVVVLGAGTAGTMLVNKLRRRLDDTWTITVVDRDDAHPYQPGFLFVPSGVPVKDLFRLFPQKPAKKMAYVAGLPKPVGCV